MDVVETLGDFVEDAVPVSVAIWVGVPFDVPVVVCVVVIDRDGELVPVLERVPSDVRDAVNVACCDLV